MKIILDNCAIDLVPKSWEDDKSIANYIKKYKRRPLRNASIHQHLLQGIPITERYDRPDILHFGLLTVLGYSKLIEDLEIYFKCPLGTFYVDKDSRLPRDQNRFYGIIENLFSNIGTNKFIKKSYFDIDLDKTIIFTSDGQEINDLELNAHDKFVFGGFAHGSLSNKYPNYKKIALASHPLDLWTSLSIFLNLIK